MLLYVINDAGEKILDVFGLHFSVLVEDPADQDSGEAGDGGEWATGSGWRSLQGNIWGSEMFALSRMMAFTF